jgi:hypothetical protein
MPTELSGLALALMAALHPLFAKTPDAPAIADGIVQAVLDDPTHLTGSATGDVALMALYAVKESGVRRCAVGDGGRALGSLQLQGVPAALACDPASAARIWLGMAHASERSCADLDPDARLAQLVSGSCLRGRQLARSRLRETRAILSSLLSD